MLEHTIIIYRIKFYLKVELFIKGRLPLLRKKLQACACVIENYPIDMHMHVDTQPILAWKQGNDNPALGVKFA